MRFILFASVVAVASAANSQADIDANKQLIEDVMKVMKDDSVSAADKKAKFTEALGNLKGDFKAKYDELVTETKAAVAALPSEAAKKAANELISLWDNGSLFESKEKVFATVQNIFKDLSAEDKKTLHELQNTIGEKFKAAFQEIIPAHH